MPTVTVGYDCSPRWSRESRFQLKTLDYPYEPIVINNTPEKFEMLCEEGIQFARRTGAPALFVNAWNEWTEGNVLLPEKRHGLGYLEAVANASKSSRT